ncbi:MAG: hypothetical protein HYR85_02550 [Planctomycetes bacterium]|nr:hypothetical protein [Planctomycetota bacterium]MBI3847679.1 hypothetical protein [Planctomycetota bacterium]
MRIRRRLRTYYEAVFDATIARFLLEHPMVESSFTRGRDDRRFNLDPPLWRLLVALSDRAHGSAESRFFDRCRAA